MLRKNKQSPALPIGIVGGATRHFNMITLEEKIARTQRLLRRLEDDRPYFQTRLSELGAEYRQSANDFAERVRAEAEAELQRLLAERSLVFRR